MTDSFGDDPLVAELRTGDRARYLGLFFAPQDKRGDLAALYALALELSRIPARASEPMPGEIRLQWWREVFSGERQAEARQNPLSRRVLEVIARRHLPVAPFLDMLEARSFDLYHDPIETMGQLEGYAGQTASALMQLAALVLNNGRPPPSPDVAGYGGVALAIADILTSASRTLAQGQTYLPQELLARHGIDAAHLHAGQMPKGAGAVVQELVERGLAYLEKARAAAEGLEPHLMPAFLELALVEPRLRRLQRRGAEALSRQVELPFWRQQWHVWRAARRGRF